MARRGPDSSVAKEQNSNQRVSVFDRLGPKTQNGTSRPHSEAPKDDEFAIPARRLENPYPNRRHRGRGGNRQQNLPREGPKNVDRDSAAAASTPKVQIKPNALLHRSLQDVKKERNKEDAIEDLERRLQQAESLKSAADELSSALLLTQQTILQDKSSLQAENVRLKREIEALKERLTYLDIGGGGGSPASPRGDYAHGDGVVAGGYAEYDDGGLVDQYAEEQYYHQAITPDSGMLKALKMKALAAADSGDGGGLHDEDEDALAHLEDLKGIAKKLEEEIK